jgi:type II secretory pathway component PulM
MTPEALLRFWSERSPRERAALLAAGGFLAAALVFSTLIDPAFKGIRGQQHSLPAARAQAPELQSLLAEVRALRTRPAVAGSAGQDAQPALEHSLAGAGLKATRIVPLSNGALQLTFANVKYSAWSQWLAATERELGMHAIAVTARATATPGSADVELALRAGRE